MLHSNNEYIWLLALIYIFPVIILFKAVKRLAATFREKQQLPVARNRQRPSIKIKQKLLFLLPIAIFIAVIFFRTYGQFRILALNKQTEFFNDVWIYVLFFGVPITLVGIVIALMGLYKNQGKAWPLIYLAGNFATLFIISVISILLIL